MSRDSEILIDSTARTSNLSHTRLSVSEDFLSPCPPFQVRSDGLVKECRLESEPSPPAVNQGDKVGRKAPDDLRCCPAGAASLNPVGHL